MTARRQNGFALSTVSEQAYASRLLARLQGERYPYAGQWELTCRCNLECVMCYTDPFNKPERIRQELGTDEIRRILDELCEAGCLELCFTGGEPFARPDFLEIYTYAKRKGFRLTLFTNGTLITPRVADCLAAFRPEKIEISFHGLTPESFDAITGGPGSFERCLSGIRLLLERKLPVTLKALGMTVNRGEILEIKALAASLGEAVRFKFGADMRPRLDDSEDPLELQLSAEEIRAIQAADAKMWAERTRDEEAQRDRQPECGGGRYTFHIDAYGQLQLCSNNRRRSYDLRRGSFREGFYEALPQFPCPRREVVIELQGRSWSESFIEERGSAVGVADPQHSKLGNPTGPAGT
jgi:MoaA/NifB/PqqE/SkfB family radical SAM enzyme